MKHSIAEREYRNLVLSYASLRQQRHEAQHRYEAGDQRYSPATHAAHSLSKAQGEMAKQINGIEAHGLLLHTLFAPLPTYEPAQWPASEEHQPQYPAPPLAFHVQEDGSAASPIRHLVLQTSPASIFRGQSQPFHNFVLTIDHSDWRHRGLLLLRLGREIDWSAKPRELDTRDISVERVSLRQDGLVYNQNMLTGLSEFVQRRWIGDALVELLRVAWGANTVAVALADGGHIGCSTSVSGASSFDHTPDAPTSSIAIGKFDEEVWEVDAGP